MKAFVAILAIALLAVLSSANIRVHQARADAERHRLSAETIAAQTDRIQDSLTVLLVDVERGRKDLDSLHAIASEAARNARRERMRASSLADSLLGRVEGTAGDSVAVINLVDSIVGAKDDEIRAVEVRLSVALTENEALWGQLQRSDDALDASLSVNALLRAELEERTLQAEAWERAANPSLLLRWGGNAAKVALGVGVAFLLLK